jgi:OmpA-OmpF porin, OOP family
MKNLIIALLFVLGGCTLYSGPTVNARLVGNPNAAAKTFDVECTGLMEDTGSCLKKARELCAVQPGSPQMRVLELIGPLGRTPDRLLVRCEFPQVVQPAPVPAPAVQPAPVQLPAKILLHGDALFDFDKADLKPAGRAALDDLVAQAQGKHFRMVQVSGYTDSVGSESYNNALSMRRARSVATYLQGHGLDADRFAVDGFGKSNPVASNATKAGRAQNRRVELIMQQE